MKIFVIAMFCLFSLNILTSAGKLIKNDFDRFDERGRPREVTSLLVSVFFLVWTGILLF